MIKKYSKPKLEVYGDLIEITKDSTFVKGLDGSDDQNSGS